MSTPLVRSADIAALANVSRAAVTQWRKRHKDFPAPAEGSDPDSPLFDRNEVEQWLIRRGRLPEPQTVSLTPTVASRRITDYLRGTDVQDGTALAGAALAAEYLTRTLAEDSERDGSVQSLIRTTALVGTNSPATLVGLTPDQAASWLQLLASASPEAALALSPLEAASGEAVDFTLSIYRSVSGLATSGFLAVYDDLLREDRARSDLIDPPALSSFLADLVDLSGISGQATVLDPAMGIASTLLTIGLRHNEANVIGVEIAPSTHATAVRRGILANCTMDLRVGNSLGDDPASGVLADAVVATPPWGLREFGPDVDVHDPRWLFGRPSPRSDGIWLQHAITHLADGGRAFVITTRSELFRSGPSESLRHELLRQGAIEAIIQLPPDQFTPAASVETAMWVLARPGQAVDPDRVLLISLPPTGGAFTTATSEAFKITLQEYGRWRSSGHAADTKRSMVVPVRQLLEPRVGLEPDVWLQQRDAPGPQELLDQIHAAQAELGEALDSTPLAIPPLGSAGTVRREKLTNLPGVTLIRGTPQVRLAEAEAATGAPVLTGRTLHCDLDSGPIEPARYVDTQQLPAEMLTRPGDIAVSVVTSVGSSPAKRIDLAGWVISSHVFLVRVDPDVPGAPDVDYLVNCINATTHAHHHPRIAHSLRIMPSHIEIPVIAAAEQQQIADLVRTLADATAAAVRRLTLLRELTGLIAVGTGTGTLTTKT